MANKKMVLNSEMTAEGSRWLWERRQEFKNPDTVYYWSLLHRNHSLLVALAEAWLEASESFPVKLFKYEPKVVEYPASYLCHHISGEMGEEEATFSLF